jgi:two-component system chemotaxis response regulator CheB
MIRVLVVDDSPTVRRYLCEVLSRDPGFLVVGSVGSGEEAIRACRALRPDVITLDIAMPGMDGLAVTEQIMAYQPTPIVVVSAAANRAESSVAFSALAAGAVEVLDKPGGTSAGDRWERRLLATVRRASRIRVITHVRGRTPARPVLARAEPLPPATAPVRVIGIGASTGGPGTLRAILTDLPADVAVPMLAVIHMDRSFDASFVAWLAGQVPRPVALAKDGMPLPPVGRGVVLVAPAGRHLVLDGTILRLVAGPPRHACLPSIDTLFESLAASLGPETAGCLLTGMGRDGARGLLAIRRAGGHTVAQDQASSVVFGMPAAAIELGGAECVAAAEGIAMVLTGWARGRHTCGPGIRQTS